MDQAHADQPPVVIDALDRVSVQLELGYDGGYEVDPAGMQLRKSDRLVASPAQSLQQSLLLGVSARHRRIVASSRSVGASGRFRAAPLRLDVRRLGVWSPPTAVRPRSTHALSDGGRWRGGVAALDAEPTLRIKVALSGRRRSQAVESRWCQCVMLV
jgi:hypothetical protein